jgi:TIR domain
VADIFVSYTASDRDWAFWIGQELEKLGHSAHIHEWEIGAGGNMPAWMQERQDKADHTLCVVSAAYLSRPYSSWELQAAQWATASERPNFMLPVFVENCKAPTMLAPFKRCDLFGMNELEARARLQAYLKPAAKPSEASRFPGGEMRISLAETAVFPGSANVSTPVRDYTPAEIDEGLKRDNSSVSQTFRDVSPTPRAERGSMPRLLLIGVVAICALGVIAWLLTSLQGGANVKVGDCGVASSGTATGNIVNCGSPRAPPAAKP